MPGQRNLHLSISVGKNECRKLIFNWSWLNFTYLLRDKIAIIFTFENEWYTKKDFECKGYGGWVADVEKSKQDLKSQILAHILVLAYKPGRLSLKALARMMKLVCQTSPLLVYFLHSFPSDQLTVTLYWPQLQQAKERKPARSPVKLVEPFRIIQNQTWIRSWFPGVNVSQ